MKLDDLCAVFDSGEFPAAEAREHPERASVLAAREAVAGAVRDDDFLVDCMARELDLVETRTPRRGLVPFFRLPGLGIGFSFGYWSPGSRAGAHEHTAWTITAVCRNALEVRTYDRAESYRQRTLVDKNLFDAPAGRAGFIYEPCIHAPSNPTSRWSMSLHLYSPRDGEPADDFDEACLPVLGDERARRFVPWDEPYQRVLDARHRQLVIRQIAELLTGTAVETADGLLARCLAEGSAHTRGFIEGLGRTERLPADRRRPQTMVLTHPDLVLASRDVDGAVALGVETTRGWVEELRMARLARKALEFCSRTARFVADEIPGRLTEDERVAIAEALEESGLFRREASQ